MKKIIVLLFFIASSAQAAFLIETMSGYSSNTNTTASETSSSDIHNHLLIGASIGQKQRFYIGQNISIISQSIKNSGENKYSSTELGPRLTYYFNDENVYYVSMGWNPYAKGTVSVSGVSDKFSGWSYMGTLGAAVKINNNFHLGVSLNYHTLSVTEKVNSSNVTSKVSETYNSMMPMITLSLRFR
jgi:hypothetical protein